MTNLQNTPMDSHVEEYCDYVLDIIKDLEFPNKLGMINDFENVKNGTIRDKYNKVFMVLQNTLYREYNIPIVGYPAFRRAKILNLNIET